MTLQSDGLASNCPAASPRPSGKAALGAYYREWIAGRSVFVGLRREEEAVEKAEIVLTLTGLAGLQQRRPVEALATCRVSLAEAISSLPNRLALL